MSVTRASFVLVLSMLVSGGMSACVLPSRGECTSRWSAEEIHPGEILVLPGLKLDPLRVPEPGTLALLGLGLLGLGTTRRRAT